MGRPGRATYGQGALGRWVQVPPPLRAGGPPHSGPGVQTQLGVHPPQMCAKCITTLNGDDTSTYKHPA